MAYQKVTTTSYGGRLKKAFQGVGMGFLMLIAGTVLLFWNEGRTVKTTKMLKEAQGVCTELGDVQQLNVEADGKMVHATGFATTEDILTDGDFDISVNAIKLIRSTEFYQWVEHQHSETKDKVGGGQETVTTYTYSKEWVSSPVNSSSFEDPDYRGIDNSVLMNVESQSWQAQNVTFGAYTFPESLISQMNDAKAFQLELKPEVLQYYETEFHRVYNVSDTQSFMHPNGNQLYLGVNPSSPTVGDVRITYKEVLPGDVSILAKVNGNTFEKYTAKNGYSLITLEDGIVDADQMFANEHAANKTMAWILRLLGVLLVFWGFKNIFNIITQLLKVLPFLGNIAEPGGRYPYRSMVPCRDCNRMAVVQAAARHTAAAHCRRTHLVPRQEEQREEGPEGGGSRRSRRSRSCCPRSSGLPASAAGTSGAPVRRSRSSARSRVSGSRFLGCPSPRARIPRRTGRIS